MEADFSGWATKANVKCADGRTIMPNAFLKQDGMRVPLVWQHGHSDPENVLGHAILENRPEGVYAYGFFNKTGKAVHSATLVEHEDINQMSIWANQLVERGGSVIHGFIREVSLVLSGANPGALIESVTIRHSDGDEFEADDEAIIYTGLELEHENLKLDNEEATSEVSEETSEETTNEDTEVVHADDNADGERTAQDVLDTLNEEQQDLVSFMIATALESVKQSGIDDNTEDNTDDDTQNADSGNQEGTDTMKHNVFEGDSKGEETAVLSHDAMAAISTSAQRLGSLKHAFEDYALQHGITNIDTLFPDYQNVDQTPEWLSRRMEWVTAFLSATRKSPFSKIRTLRADITESEARAKGYIKGNMKKEEFFSVTKRETSPTTVYKKQAIDRDDIVDITDFDVIAWVKGEMRVMLDEEVARAALIGDGRDIADLDKINEQCIRPIATDNELFATTVNVNIDDANSSIEEVTDAVISSRQYYKGTGMPTFFTTETTLARFLNTKDTQGRRIYDSVAAVATVLRVSNIVTVELMDEVTDLVGIIVNPIDYTFGATAGGQVSLFDDFDIDYNKQKYLIETRTSGCLTKLKSAIVLRKVASTTVIVTPTKPTFVPTTGVITIPTVTGVVYKNGAGTTLTAGAQTALAAGASLTVTAFASGAGYALSSTEGDTWKFTRLP